MNPKTPATFGVSVHAGDALAFEPSGNIAVISTTGVGGGYGGDVAVTAQAGIMKATSISELSDGSTMTTMVGGGNGVAGAVGRDLEGNLTFQLGASEGLATSSTYDVSHVTIIACTQ